MTEKMAWRRLSQENTTLSNMLDHYHAKIKPDSCLSAKYLHEWLLISLAYNKNKCS